MQHKFKKIGLYIFASTTIVFIVNFIYSVFYISLISVDDRNFCPIQSDYAPQQIWLSSLFFETTYVKNKTIVKKKKLTCLICWIIM